MDYLAPGEALDNVLEFAAISKVFDDGTEAVRAIDLAVRQAEFVAVVGPSGCGKSTLLRIAAALMEPTTGRVRVDRRGLGYVFQDPTLMPWRNVQRNVELFAELRGVERGERGELARQALAAVGLAGTERKYPRALSGGMRMRVSLARSLSLSPNVFLFDEPFGAVDEITRERLNEELLRLYGERRFAALFVTHSISEAAFLATRVVVMSARPGRIVGDFPVHIPYPREPGLRFDPCFNRLTSEINACLRSVS